MSIKRLERNLYNGKAAYGCQHMAEWQPVFERYLIHLGEIKYSLDIVQAQGGSILSGGTHIEGTCLDLANCSTGIVNAARAGGAPATWGRGPWVANIAESAAVRGFSNHVHLHILCPCRSGADYQTAQVKAGQDGLVTRGRDYHQRPAVWRDYKAGIAWMEAQMTPSTPLPAPAHTPVATPTKTSSTIVAAGSGGKDVLDMTSAELEAIVRRVVRDELNRPFAGPWMATFGGGTRAMDKIAALVKGAGK